MQELISEQVAHSIADVLAMAGPPLGAVVGAVVGLLRKTGFRDIKKGLAIGSLGLLNWILWRIYNAVTNELGLSSVANLLAQMGLFILIGIAAGLLYITFCVKPRHT